MYIHVNLKDKFAENFLSTAIASFYSQIETLKGLLDLEEHFNNRMGEKSFTDIFDKGLWQIHGRDKLISLQQIWVKKDENKSGIPDLLVQYLSDTLFLIECKLWHAYQDEPDTPDWGEVKTRGYYEWILNQARSYLYETSLFSKYTHKYIVTLTFSPVIFENTDYIKKWFYGDLLENEFYAFSHYLINDRNFGLALYGVIEKVTQS